MTQNNKKNLFIDKCEKEILRCAHILHMCVIFSFLSDFLSSVRSKSKQQRINTVTFNFFCIIFKHIDPLFFLPSFLPCLHACLLAFLFFLSDLALSAFVKFLTLFSNQVNLLFLLYLDNLWCFFLHLIRQSYLQEHLQEIQ